MLTGLTLAVLAACTADNPTEPHGFSAASATIPTDRVDDLALVAASDSTIELRWTQVDDGTGRPALYRLKYAEPAILWATATVGCNAKGSSIGSPVTCTVRGLNDATYYDFQLMSYRLENGQWRGAVYSNVARGTTLANGATAVTDLAVTVATASSLRVQWTQVGYGSNGPAQYRVRYGAPPITWSTATTACDTTLNGAVVGAAMTCTINGLAPGATYDVQLMSYRVVNGIWQDTELSNVATGTALASADPVVDLAASAATDTTITVRWTEVDDGTGSPAWYRVRYSAPPLAWSAGQLACDAIAGAAIGSQKSCTISGLPPAASYDVQVQSYRNVSGASDGEALSNVATGRTQAESSTGIWISPAELASRPTSGADWNRLLQDASRALGTADIGDQDSQHDVNTLAAALVCVRTGQYCAKARQGVLDAMYTEEDPSDADGDPIPMARWMAVGRNLGSYVIAADLLDLRRGGSTGTDGARVQTWIESFLTKDLVDSNDRTLLRGWEPFSSGSNGAAQQGFAYAAVAAYLRDRSRLDFIWEAFRTFVCDPGAVNVADINLSPPIRDGWTDAANPCAVNRRGSAIRVPSGLPGAGGTYRVDGSLSADMRRGGVYQWQPGYTQYPWVGLEGLIPAAVVLERAGYPAFAAGDQAVLRTHQYLWWVRNQTGDSRWFDGVRSSEIVHLVNVIYDQSFPVNETPGRGRTVGYTGWTHPR